MIFSRTSLGRATSPVAIVSLFLVAVCSFGSAEGIELSTRARAKRAPVSVEQPPNWEVFDKGDEQSGEILFLQSPAGEAEKTVHLSLHFLSPDWEGLIKRQNYHLIVNEGVPIITNEALTLRGSRGHKWVYRAESENGNLRLYYRLYLALPASVGSKRLLVVQGSAPAESAPTSVPFFNELARSLSWGLAADQVQDL